MVATGDLAISLREPEWVKCVKNIAFWDGTVYSELFVVIRILFIVSGN